MKFLKYAIFYLVLVYVPIHATYADQIVSGYININTEDATVLKYLPGIGASRAKKIIRSREKAPFREPSNLLTRKLISKKVFRKIQSFITVVGESRYELKLSASDRVVKKYPGNSFERYNTYAQVYLLPDYEFIKALEQKIRDSRSSVVLATYVFTLSRSKSNKVLKLVNLLADTVKRGVPVSVILEKSDHNKSVNNNNTVSSMTLKKKGIRVFFDNPKQTQHSKLAVIDGRWVFIGSHNMTHSALDINREYSVMIDSPLIGYQVSEYLNSLKH